MKSHYKKLLTYQNFLAAEFGLYYFEEKKNAEIALQCNISVRTVETHIYHALKLLQKAVLAILLILLFAKML